MSRSALADLLRVLEGRAAAEHREPREERLLVLAEKVVAPRDRRAQRGVALVGIATALEEIEPLPDPLEQLLRAEQLDASGGELDREREAVEPCGSARGRPASRRRSARTACARSRNSVTASASTIGGRSSSTSPAIRSGSRLVATIRSEGAAASSSAIGRAASGSSCSRLSRTT